jgi:hypothetical protein
MKNLKELYWLLNVKIKQDIVAKMISLSQEAYIERILKHFNPQDVKTVSMPIDLNMKLSKDQCSQTDKEKDHVRNVPYCQAIGSLMWAAVTTRPDIAFC